MATTISFPAAPTIGDTHTHGSVTFTWSGSVWFIDTYVADDVDIVNLSPKFKNIGLLTPVAGAVTWSWNTDESKSLTMTEDTTITISDLYQGGQKTLYLTGAFVPTFAGAIINVTDNGNNYNGTVVTEVLFTCSNTVPNTVTVTYSHTV